MRRIAGLRMAPILALAAALAAPLLAQEPAAETFEVASVRINQTGDRTSYTDTEPGGRFIATNMPLRTLITSAYDLRSFELIGAPDWTGAERFDIVARAAREFGPAAPGRPDPDKLMLRSLLANRFALRVHRETRELPIYALTPARADGRLGPRIRRSQTGCAAPRRAGAAAAKGGGRRAPALLHAQRLRHAGGQRLPDRRAPWNALVVRRTDGRRSHRTDRRMGSRFHMDARRAVARRDAARRRSQRTFAVHGAAGAARPEARIDERLRRSPRGRSGGAAFGGLAACCLDL